MLPESISPRLDASIIDDEKLDYLSLLYLVCSMAPAEVSFLCRSLKASIQKQGTELNSVNMEGKNSATRSCSATARLRSGSASQPSHILAEPSL